MKQFFSIWLFIVAMAMTLTSCEVVGGLIEFGFWIGIILVVLVVVIILWIARKLRR